MNTNVYAVKHSIVDKNREDQSVLVQDLMLELSNKYNEVFMPANVSVEQTYLEGVENCVCKNLYSVLFVENGVGAHQNLQAPQNDTNIPAPVNQVSPAHLKETE